MSTILAFSVLTVAIFGVPGIALLSAWTHDVRGSRPWTP